MISGASPPRAPDSGSLPARAPAPTTPRGSSVTSSRAPASVGSHCSTSGRPSAAPGKAGAVPQAGGSLDISHHTDSRHRHRPLTHSCTSPSDSSSAHSGEPAQSQCEAPGGSGSRTGFRGRAGCSHGSRASSRARASLAARSQCRLGRRHSGSHTTARPSSGPSVMPFQAQSSSILGSWAGFHACWGASICPDRDSRGGPGARAMADSTTRLRASYGVRARTGYAAGGTETSPSPGREPE